MDDGRKEALNKQIFEMYVTQGISAADISAQLGVTRGLIYSRLAKMPGYKSHEKRLAMTQINSVPDAKPDLESKLLALYNSGYSLADLAVQENISAFDVRQMLIHTGQYQPHSTNFPNMMQDKDLMEGVFDVMEKRNQAVVMYASGSTVKEISKALGWCQERVVYSLRKMNHHVYSEKEKPPKTHHAKLDLDKLTADIQDIKSKLGRLVLSQNTATIYAPSWEKQMKDLQALVSQMSRWIPVTEQRPPEDGQYSMIMSHGITYWCRLPPLPE